MKKIKNISHFTRAACIGVGIVGISAASNICQTVLAQAQGTTGKPPVVDIRKRQPTPPAKSGPQAKPPAAGNVFPDKAAPILLPAATPPPPEGKDDLWSEHSRSGQNPAITIMQNWIYRRSDMIVNGASAQFNRTADTLECEDLVVVDDKKHHITGDKAHIEHVDANRALRTVTLSGHVVLVLKPETPESTGAVPPAAVLAPGSAVPAAPGQLRAVNLPGQPPAAPPATDKDKDRQKAKDEKSHGGIANCDNLVYKTAAKFATLTGHVVFTQTYFDKDGKKIERKMTCEHAENDGKANKLRLFKPVHYEDNQNKTVQTEADVIVGTKDGEETLEMGPSRIQFPSESDDEDDTPKKGAKPTGKPDTKDSGTSKDSGNTVKK